MENGGPSPLSPPHCCGRMWSSQRGPPPLIRGSGVGGAALPPSPGPTLSLLHLGATAPLRLQPAHAHAAWAARLHLVGRRTLSTGNPAGFCLSRGLVAGSRIGRGPPAPPHRLTASGQGEIRLSRRSSRPIGHVYWPPTPESGHFISVFNLH
ncbi:hypothetical protein NDU88_006201 [Pleurodeles waltl]|uniref:Uncharacterized protein n=1 Tax=Pleurodeles waltl TaxID=8319 RepID=A0AAV7NQ31_PLEWA|nr:hypothetical protein NDU88_006201 [Pleurodeles waltl]